MSSLLSGIVIPAEAGVQRRATIAATLAPRFRGNDGEDGVEE
jgi:hypothetical protein